MSDLPVDFYVNEDDLQFVNQLMEQKYTELHAVLMAMLKYNKDDVDACIEQIYFTAIKKASTLRKHVNPTGWLFRTMQLCGKKYLARKHAQIRANFNVPYELLLNLESTSYDVEVIDDETIAEMKQKCLCELTDKEKETYDMFYVQHLTIKEIAKQTSSSESSIKVRLFRMRDKLSLEAQNILKSDM